MDFLRMIMVQFKQNCKNPGMMLNILLVPICLTLLLYFGMGSGGTAENTLIINHDTDPLAQEFLDSLPLEYRLMENEEEAVSLIEERSADSLYIIPEDFGSILKSGSLPVLKSYKLGAPSDTEQLYDFYMENALQELSKKQHFINANIIPGDDLPLTISIASPLLSGDSMITIVLVLFFMYTVANVSVQHLGTLKTSRSLQRILSTNHSNTSILSSYILANYLFQLIFSLLSFLLLKTVIGFELNRLGHVVLAAALLGIVSISQGILFLRIIRRPELFPMINSLFTMICLLAGMMVILKDTIAFPQPLLVLSQFSPFYWAYDITLLGNLFPGVFILLLFALVFISGGSYKFQEFVKE